MASFHPNLTSATLVVLDDTHPRITYTGRGWDRFENVNSVNVGNGRVHNNTITFTQESNESISLGFEGNYVALYGSLNTLNDTKAPRYSCKLDGDTDISPVNHYKTGKAYNVVLCESSLIENGTHTVTLTTEQIYTTYPQYYPLWFDYAVYQPIETSAVSASQEVQRVYSGNIDRVKLSPPGWSQVVDGSDTWNMWAVRAQGPENGMERLKNPKIEINFEGDTLHLYGFVPDSNYTNSTAFYSLDGGEPVNFTLSTGKEGFHNYNLLWLNLTSLSSGNHTIIVEDYGSKTGGDDNSVPLAMSYFEMAVSGGGGSGGQGNASTSGSSTVGSPTAGTSSTVPSSQSNGALANAPGGVLWALLALSFVQWMVWVGRPSGKSGRWV